MFKPPHWFHKNIQFPEKEIDQVINQIQEKINNIQTLNPLITSYFLDMMERPDRIWSQQYSQLMEDVVKNMGVYTTCKYNYEYWSQYYHKNIGHQNHHHARGDLNAFGQISWVHFLRTTEKKSFVFLDNNGNTFTPKQDKGDVLIFPSYIWHEAKPDTKRFVVAGNLWITYLENT